MKIIVTGSLAFDYIMDFPGKFADHILPEKIHQINLSFLVNKLVKHNGGTAGNIAYNLALLGMKPILLATAGNDFSEYEKQLKKVGVNTNLIRIKLAEPTASAFIFTDKSDNQITGFYPGAMRASAKFKISNLKFQIDDKPFVIISPNEPEAMINHVKDCIKLGLSYMFDPGMQLPRLSDSDLKKGIENAKIVIGNDYEMALINSKLKCQKSKVQVKTQKLGQIWITTLGANGCEIIQCDQFGKLVKYKIPPAKPKAVLDPTGAGDAFRAGFLAGFLSGQDLLTCGKMGNLTAVYTVEKYGTQTHKFTKSEFCQRYRGNFEEKLVL